MLGERRRDDPFAVVFCSDLTRSFRTAEIAFSEGWRHIKLYFMIGLPTERDEDVLAIADLGIKVYEIARKYGRANKVTISVGGFIPKPHTPFQWAAQDPPDEIKRKLGLIRHRVKDHGGLKVRTNDPEEGVIEGLLARGDRRVAATVERACQLGARFNEWHEMPTLDLWRRALDEVGLDVAHKVGKVLGQAFPDRTAPSSSLEKLTAAGRLGRKSGLGFYRHAGKRRHPDPSVRRLLGVSRERAYREALTDRLVLAMVNEAARCLDEKVVADAGAIDLAMIFGAGFPPFRGGVLRHADTVGLPKVEARLTALRAEKGERFAPSALLSRLAAEGGTFTAPIASS